MTYVKPKIDETSLLIITVGLPRSGKSTWARSRRLPIVNRDAIRLAIHGERFLKDTEELVKAAALYMIKALFLAGHDMVILDETCTTKSRRDSWRVGRPWTTVFHHVDTTPAVCRERALGDPAILPIIEKMAFQFEPLSADECPYSEPQNLVMVPEIYTAIDLASEPSRTGKVIVEKVDGEIRTRDPRLGETDAPDSE